MSQICLFLGPFWISWGKTLDPTPKKNARLLSTWMLKIFSTPIDLPKKDSLRISTKTQDNTSQTNLSTKLNPTKITFLSTRLTLFSGSKTKRIGLRLRQIVTETRPWGSQNKSQMMCRLSLERQWKTRGLEFRSQNKATCCSHPKWKTLPKWTWILIRHHPKRFKIKRGW